MARWPCPVPAADVVELYRICTRPASAGRGGESEAEDSEPTEAEAPEVNEELRTDAIRALNTLGFPKERAKQAVSEALHADPDATLEEIVKCALRRQK